MHNVVSVETSSGVPLRAMSVRTCTRGWSDMDSIIAMTPAFPHPSLLALLQPCTLRPRATTSAGTRRLVHWKTGSRGPRRQIPREGLVKKPPQAATPLQEPLYRVDICGSSQSPAQPERTPDHSRRNAPTGHIKPRTVGRACPVRPLSLSLALLCRTLLWPAPTTRLARWLPGSDAAPAPWRRAEGSDLQFVGRWVSGPVGWWCSLVLQPAAPSPAGLGPLCAVRWVPLGYGCLQSPAVPPLAWFAFDGSRDVGRSYAVVTGLHFRETGLSAKVSAPCCRSAVYPGSVLRASTCAALGPTRVAALWRPEVEPSQLAVCGWSGEHVGTVLVGCMRWT